MAHKWQSVVGNPARRVRAVRLIGVALVSGIMTATAAGAAENDPGLGSLWRLDPAAPPAELQRNASSDTRELVTREEAVALALEANHLVKSPDRRQLIAETVRRAYGDAVAAHRTLAVREERLKAAMRVERLVADMARQGKATPSDVLHAQAGLARMVQDVQESRAAFATQSRQLNHLMGRDLQARLRVRPEAGPPPAAAVRGGSAAVRGE
jgi:hypothetical protein